MLLIHAKSYHQALNYARGCKPPLGYTEWNYATADSLKGLRGLKMMVLPGAEGHEEHEEIMEWAKVQGFEVVKP
jgi:hypothetical protein